MTDETTTQVTGETSKIKVDVLLKALEHTQTNYRFLFTRAQSILSWIGSVLLAIIGGITILGSSGLAAFGVYLRVGVTVAICSLFVLAWITDVLAFRLQVQEGESAAKIGRLLHFFETGYFDEQTALFDEDIWTNWMGSPMRRLGIAPGTSVLFILTVIAIVTVWAQ